MGMHRGTAGYPREAVATPTTCTWTAWSDHCRQRIAVGHRRVSAHPTWFQVPCPATPAMTEILMLLLPTVRRLARLAAACLLATGIALFASGTTITTAAMAATSSLPCDIYAAGGTPCEAAYSTTRALFASYNGPLYQIQRASDGSHLNIGLDSTGGVVNSAPQVSFCSGTTCTITEIYDQTSNGNNMPISPGTSCSGCSSGISGPGPNGSDIGANAMALPVTVGGQPAYGALFNAHGTGYRINNAKNVPTGSQPEGVYMMTSSNLTSSGCCFDFGSAETNDSDDGNATMNAIYYGTDCWTAELHRHRSLGRRRPRERHVLQQHRQQPLEHRERERLVPLRVGEEQRHDQLHPEIRQRPVKAA